MKACIHASITTADFPVHWIHSKLFPKKTFTKMDGSCMTEGGVTASRSMSDSPHQNDPSYLYPRTPKDDSTGPDLTSIPTGHSKNTQETRKAAYTCPNSGCLGTFSTKSNLQRHIRSKHGLPIQTPCGRKSSSSWNLKRHTVSCQQCRKLMHSNMNQTSMLVNHPIDFFFHADLRNLRVQKPSGESQPSDFDPIYQSSLNRDTQSYWKLITPISNLASEEPSTATPRDTISHRIMNDLVFKALQDLETRLESQISQYQQAVGQEGGKAPTRKRGRQPRTPQQPPPSKRQATSWKKQKSPMKNGNDHPSDDDSTGSSPGDGKDDSDAGDAEQKYLACPLFRKDPRRYAACAKCRLRRIRDVKQHMRRKHKRPEFYCPTCWETYSRPDERDVHLMERSCNASDGSGPPWITQEQDTQLEGRVPKGTTVEQWYTVWDIVCPGQTRPKPPFCFLGRMIEDISTLRRELWEEEGPEIVEELVTQREATLREPLSTENRSLLQRCIVDAVRHVLEHPDVTRAGQLQWNQGDGRSEAPSVPQPPSRAHSIPEDGPDRIHHQPPETRDNLLQHGPTSTPNQGLQFDGTLLGDLDLTSWWASEAFEGFDVRNLNFLDAFTPTFIEGHETSFDYASGPTSA